jgi:hypothetical protein
MKDSENKQKNDVFNEHLKDVFIQTEDITLLGERFEYPIVLNSNYAYCNGVIIDETANNDVIFGLKKGSRFLLDEAPVKIYKPSYKIELKKRLLKLQTKAGGTQVYVSVDKNGETLTTFKAHFFLSNIRKKAQKMNMTFDKVVCSGAATYTGSLNLDQNYKYLRGVYFYNDTGSSVTLNYLKTGNKYLLESLKDTYFRSENVEVKKRFLPLFHKKGSLDYSLTVTGAANIYFVFLYE